MSSLLEGKLIEMEKLVVNGKQIIPSLLLQIRVILSNSIIHKFLSLQVYLYSYYVLVGYLGLPNCLNLYIALYLGKHL